MDLYDRNILDEFFTVGYFIKERLFSLEEVEVISEIFDRIQAKAESLTTSSYVDGTQFIVEKNQISRVVWTCAMEPLLKKYATDPRITRPISQVLGSKTMQHLICQAHFKLPGDGVKFSWHQDSDHRRFGTDMWHDVNGRGSYVQSILAIDPMTHENAPIMVLPGSCKEGHLGLSKRENATEFVNEEDLQPVIMEPGSVLFFGPYLIHGSKENTSDKPRRVFINGFAYPGANSRIYPGQGAGYMHSIA